MLANQALGLEHSRKSKLTSPHELDFGSWENPIYTTYLDKLAIVHSKGKGRDFKAAIDRLAQRSALQGQTLVNNWA